MLLFVLATDGRSPTRHGHKSAKKEPPSPAAAGVSLNTDIASFFSASRVLLYVDCVCVWPTLDPGVQYFSRTGRMIGLRRLGVDKYPRLRFEPIL